MATINHKKYDEATETFKDFNVYDGKETLIFKVDGEAGKVGIGTTSLEAALDIRKDSGVYELVRIQNASAGALYRAVGYGGGSVDFGADDTAASTAIFRTAGSERMRITSAGYVGVGTTSPVTIFTAEDTNANIAVFNVIGTSPNYIFDVRDDGTSVFRVAGTGNVGIGTSSPSMALELVKNSTVGLGGNVYYSARFLQDKTNFRGVFLAYDTSGQTAVIGAESAGAASELAFYTYSGSAWGERVTVTSNGLTFNGDKAAANALDDYEEGTFTPTYAGGLTGVTYSTRYGSYTKIGNRVMFDLRIQATSVAGTSGSLVIGGLPFATNGAVISNATIGYFGVYTTDIVYCLIDTSAVDAILFYQKDATPLLGSELTADTSAIHLSGVYFV